VKYAADKGTKPAVVYSTNAGYCSGIAVDKSGYVYVSNSGLNDITVYNNSGVYQYTIN
jgi:hypothetical protein